MFAAVAIGVRKDAAAATATLISTGRADTPMSLAAVTAIGTTITAVAALLITGLGMSLRRPCCSTHTMRCIPRR